MNKKIYGPLKYFHQSFRKSVDINIHPEEAGTYKIIYHGALLGDIFMGNNNNNWQAVTTDQLEPGGYPVYEFGENSGHQYLLLDEIVTLSTGIVQSISRTNEGSRGKRFLHNISVHIKMQPVTSFYRPS